MKQLAIILSTILAASQAFAQTDIPVFNHTFDRFPIPGTIGAAAGPYNSAELIENPGGTFDYLIIENTGFVNNAGVEVPNQSPSRFGWDLVRPDGDTVYSASNGAVILDTAIGNYYQPGEAGSQVGGIFLTNLTDGVRIGLRQATTHVIQPGELYRLSVDVGDPQTDPAYNFNLDGFPGYDIELRAAGQLLATTGSNTLATPEGTMSTVGLQFNSDNAPATAIGERLEIYLLSRNNTAGVTGMYSEVNFDNVQLRYANVNAPANGRNGRR